MSRSAVSVTAGAPRPGGSRRPGPSRTGRPTERRLLTGRSLPPGGGLPAGRRPPARRAVAAAWAVVVLGGLVACGGSAARGPAVVGSQPPAGSSPSASLRAAAAAAATCTPGPTVSYAPLASTAASAWPSGSLMQTIKERGYLVVGVSGDTRLLGARNALNGGHVEGFDIDIAKQVAQALFGRSDDAVIRFKVITAAQRIPFVNTGAGTAAAPGTGVDLIARAMTMNCQRWTDPNGHVAFSSVYLLAHQKLLVRAGSGITDVTALQKAKAKVCAPKGSTSLDNIAKFTGIQVVGQDIHSDCLALWQEGKVDAITGDDAILAGFSDQDPHAQVVGNSLEDEPYGLAVASAHPEFARYLNAVLEQVRSNGTWQRLYDRWLRKALNASAPPPPQYGR